MVVANFRPGAAVSGSLRLPAELMNAAALPVDDLVVTRIFDERGSVAEPVADTDRVALRTQGVEVSVNDQATAIFEVRAR